VEVPVSPEREGEYLYLSTVHWLPLVNGRTSYAPGSHDDLKQALGELPGPRGREYASAVGLRAVVVHRDRLSRDERTRWALAEQAGHVRARASFGDDTVYAVPETARATSLRGRVAGPETLRPGQDARLGLLLVSERGEPWAHGRPHRLAHARVRWRETTTGRTSATTVPLMLPLVVGGRETAVVPLRVTAPTPAGRYTLDVQLRSPRVITEARTIDVRDAPALATSLDAPDRLAARLDVEGGPGPRTLAAGDAIHLKVSALNTGQAVWLMKGRGKRGEVALQWRWLDGAGRTLDGGAGHAPIKYDVYPASRYEFDEWPPAPVDAGRYVLEVGLVSGGAGPFAGGEGARIVIDVAPPLTAAARP
jgi:hypothetical protein